MELTINGETQDIDLADDATIAVLIERMGLKDRPVAVERNRQIVPRREHDQTRLADGDTLELVTLVGGG